MSRLWVVTYDIAENRCRGRVHDILKNYGQRVQYSVFECWLSNKQLESLRTQVSDELESADSVRWYPLCTWCQTDVTWQGLGLVPEDKDFFLS